ncbi:MAG: DUF4097 family beta strand repeat-containing protein [Micromonosporaceae bacterium]
MASLTTQYPRSFPAAGALAVSVRLDAGTVDVTASDVTEAVVDLTPAEAGDRAALDLIEKSQVDLRGNALRIEVPRGHGFGGFRRSPAVLVKVTVPRGSSLECDTGSADLQVAGSIQALDYGTGSGDVTVEACGDVRVRTGSGDAQLREVAAASVKTGSGDITIDKSSGDLQLQTASGDIQVGDLAGDARLSTGSGDVELGTTRGRIGAKTASGDISVRRADSGDLAATTASGDVTVGVPAGTAARLDCSSVSGRVHSHLEPTDAPGDAERHLSLAARTVSGSVTILRAT